MKIEDERRPAKTPEEMRPMIGAEEEVAEETTTGAGEVAETTGAEVAETMTGEMTGAEMTAVGNLPYRWKTKNARANGMRRKLPQCH